MHRTHQEDMSPCPEKGLEAWRATATWLIEISLSQAFKQRDFFLMLPLQRSEQVAERLISVT